MSHYEKILTEPADSPGVDAFGRVRFTETVALFDGKTLADSGPAKFDDIEKSGSSTSSTFDINRASVTLGVANTTAGKRVRQSLRRFNYLTGKSQTCYISFVMGAAASGITKEVGYFDDVNGLFFRQTSSNIYMVQRRNTVDTAVSQDNWNLDRLDGTGPSGLTLDITKIQIFVVDFQWLGTGRVRMGFNINGRIFYVHEFLNTNVLDTSYMLSPNLPVRYSIENDGTGAAATLECVASAVISEGARNPIGEPFGVANSVLSGTLATGVRYALISMRLKSTHVSKAIIIPVLVSVTATTVNDAYVWEVVSDPTIAGSPVFNSVNSTSAVEWADGGLANTVTGGRILVSGVGFSRSGNILLNSQDKLQPSVSIDGTSKVISLVVRPYTNNISMAAALTWRELT